MSAAGQHDPFQPYRLWSLWEMLELHAADFMRVIVNHRTLMMRSAGIIGRLPDDFRQQTETYAKNIRAVCDSLGLTTTSDLAKWIVSAKTMEQLVSAMDAVERALNSELGQRKFFAPDQKNQRYFDSSDLFGPAVFQAFASANDDITEAGNCLALDRGTACVMHLMRIVETGLSALVRALGVTKKNDWGSYLREIERELTAHEVCGRQVIGGAVLCGGSPYDRSHAARLAQSDIPCRKSLSPRSGSGDFGISEVFHDPSGVDGLRMTTGTWPMTFRNALSKSSASSDAPISRAFSMNRSRCGFSSGSGGLRAGMETPYGSSEMSEDIRQSTLFEYDPSLALRACKNLKSTVKFGESLQDRFLATLVAICTYAMRRFAVCHRRFKDVSEAPHFGHCFQGVALLLSFPCFHLYYLFFKIVYSLNQVRLRRASSHCALLGINDLARKFDYFFLNNRLVPDAQQRLRDIQSDIQGIRDSSDYSHINHVSCPPQDPSPIVGDPQ